MQLHTEKPRPGGGVEQRSFMLWGNSANRATVLHWDVNFSIQN